MSDRSAGLLLVSLLLLRLLLIEWESVRCVCVCVYSINTKL